MQKPLVLQFPARVLRHLQRRLKRKVDSRDSLNTRRNLQGRFCSHPFTQLDVYEGGKVYSCCPTWLPKPLGSLQHDSVQRVWNSPASQAIRESILDGSFRYCDHKLCPAIQADSLPSLEDAAQDPFLAQIIETRQVQLDEAPRLINLCNDQSCNLFCPSCRRERILHTGGRELEERQHIQDLITDAYFASPSDRHFRLNVTGSGDPFASVVFRDFLFQLDGADYPNLDISLQTNGVLLTPKNWAKLHKIHRNISEVIISFDAASAETYAITRRGGHWDTLQENTRRLGELRQHGELRRLRLDFVVQQSNFHEMADFVRLAHAYHADTVAFSMVLDWGTWSPAEYRKQCIWKRSHPRFPELLEVLRDPIFEAPGVYLGNLSEVRRHALSATA